MFIRHLHNGRLVLMLITLSILFTLLNLDAALDVYKGPQWSFLLFYMMLNIFVADQIGGKFAYTYATLCALSRAYVGTLVWDGLAVELWSSCNLIIGYVMVCYLIQSKNKIANDLKRSSLTDPLTKLPNRRAFTIELERAISHSQRTREPMSLAYIDVDGFKTINDTRGHDVGDSLLICIGNTISHVLRACDIGARLGGDEFAIIFVNFSAQGATSLIRRIKSELDSMCMTNGYGVSFSVGVVNYAGEPHVSCDEIVRFADRLMYDVKNTSKNGVKIRDFVYNAQIV